MMVATALPALSVVMPTLNQRRFIGEAVRSVFAQGVSGLELIVADGGSTDGTQAELEALAAAHPGQLQWTSAPDGGPADAVNQTVARTRGEIIGWLNSDDMYTAGAAARALAHFSRHPGDVMVYGEGEHIDEQGAPLGRYPTRLPSTPLTAWANGCHVCQPTAFFRREAFQELGGLDTSLRTAFDYELWLRLFKAYPGRVGFVPELQARSRLHAAAITLRLRETVALEGLRVVHRHLGPAPARWLLTHFDELMAGLPEAEATEAPRLRLLRLVESAAGWLSPAATAELRCHLARHRALQLATANLFANVQADGWAPSRLELRLRQLVVPWATLRLQGRHAASGGTPLRLQAEWPDGSRQAFSFATPGPFTLHLPLPAMAPGRLLTVLLHCESAFVPARGEAGSSDTRELAFQVDALQPERAA